MTAISATPTFPPIGSATFNADAYAWAVHMAGTFTTEVNAAVSAMAALAAGGAVSLQYTFSTTTTDADPGAGYLRLDAATQNTATTIRADLLGNNTSDYSGVLALLDDSTSTNKGYITLRHATTPTKWLVFAVASLASPSGYKNVTVTCAASSAANPFTNGDSLLLDFTPTGDMGQTGATGATGAVGTTTIGGITGMGANVATFLATPTLANLNSAVSDADVAILGANTFTAAQTLQALLDISHASAGQIKFPATQNASADANTLDDYEEGTWTPNLLFGGGSTGMTASTLGFYTKVGRLVSCTGRVGLSAKGSSTGVATTSLPFASANTNCLPGMSVGYYDQLGSSMTVSCYINSNASTFQWTNAAGTSVTALTETAFGNSTRVDFGFSYITA